MYYYFILSEALLTVSSFAMLWYSVCIHIVLLYFNSICNMYIIQRCLLLSSHSLALKWAEGCLGLPRSRGQSPRFTRTTCSPLPSLPTVLTPAPPMPLKEGAARSSRMCQGVQKGLQCRRNPTVPSAWGHWRTSPSQIAASTCFALCVFRNGPR